MATNIISEDSFNTSEFACLYKYTSKLADSQQERRLKMLQRNKEIRHNFVDNLRELDDELFECNDNDDDEKVNNVELLEGEPEEFCEEMGEDKKTIEQDNEIMEQDNISINQRTCEARRKRYKTMNTTSNIRLMRSEWFTDIPDDLEDNWLVKFVPEGYRVLITAERGRTDIYRKSKQIFPFFKSYLPGGGSGNLRGITILDCIYSYKCNRIFVLDCLCWNDMSMMNCDTMFRFAWLESMFNDNLNLYHTNANFSFELLKQYPADRSIIQDVMLEPFLVDNEQILYDGVVFYHKEADYVMELTPLVTWLFSYMLPEKLGIDILDENRLKMPKNYTCLEQFLEDLKIKPPPRFSINQ